MRKKENNTIKLIKIKANLVGYSVCEAASVVITVAELQRLKMLMDEYYCLPADKLHIGFACAMNALVFFISIQKSRDLLKERKKIVKNNKETKILEEKIDEPKLLQKKINIKRY